MAFVQDREENARLQRNRDAGFLASIGFVTLIATILSIILSQFGGLLAAIGIGGTILAAGVAIGSFLGFLFSVPRILTKDALIEGGQPAEASKVEDQPKPRLLASNTNLERVSEWLTTMLVGVGLSQLTRLGATFRVFVDFLSVHAKVFGVSETAHAGALPIVGPFILIFGVISGFVFLYLYTRIYLSPLFQHVEEVFEDPRQFGKELLMVGQPEVQKAAAQLAQASANPSMTYAANAENLSIDQTLDVIFNLLYEKEGYKKAIGLGNLIANTTAAQLPKYWFLMCAALSQKYHALKTGGASGEELKTARRAVLDAARQAVRLDARYKKRLLGLLNAKNTDNDLQDFAQDSDMLRILSLDA